MRYKSVKYCKWLKYSDLQCFVLGCSYFCIICIRLPEKVAFYFV